VTPRCRPVAMLPARRVRPVRRRDFGPGSSPHRRPCGVRRSYPDDQSIGPVWSQPRLADIHPLLLDGVPARFAAVRHPADPAGAGPARIVARGASFVPQVPPSYATPTVRCAFAGSSLIAPFFLGTAPARSLLPGAGAGQRDRIDSWVNPTSLCVGHRVASCAFLRALS